MQKRSKWKNQFKRIDSSSNFHENVRRILSEDSFFKNLSCYQEVPVSSLVQSYNNNTHCVDWYIDELATIVELHGEQHYRITNFGNISWEQARKSFYNIRYRDNMKKTALLDAGYEYIEIDFKLKDKLTGKLLKKIILTQEKTNE